jgi:hypothetical protein
MSRDNGNVRRINFVGVSTVNPFTGPLRVSRNAELFRGIIPVNEYEDFCNEIDTLLLTQHEIHAILGQRAQCVLATLCSSIVLFLVGTLAPSGMTSDTTVLLPFMFVWNLMFLLLMLLACDIPGRRLRDKIRTKCREMTDRSALASFQYVVTTRGNMNTNDYHSLTGHIDVIVIVGMLVEVPEP